MNIEQQKIDIQMICANALDISKHAKILLEYIPEEKSMRHLAALMIHLNLFMQEFIEKCDTTTDPLVQQFLSECGCNHVKP